MANGDGPRTDLHFGMPDYGLGGFFPQLKTAQDLFAKLERDFERLKAAPDDAEIDLIGRGGLGDEQGRAGEEKVSAGFHSLCSLLAGWE